MAIITYPHGPLTALQSNTWVVTAKTSQGIDRKMTVVKAADGSLFTHDALWLDEKTFAEFDALGPLRTILVPSWLHDFDGQRFAERYPNANLVAFPATLKRLKWPTLKPLEPGLLPPGVTVTELPGLRQNECVCEVTHPEGGVTQVYTDALFNIPHGKGFKGFIFKWLGSTGPLRMTLIGRTFLLKDRAAFKSWLLAQSQRADLKHVVVGHGRVASQQVSQLLQAAAERL